MSDSVEEIQERDERDLRWIGNAFVAALLLSAVGIVIWAFVEKATRENDLIIARCQVLAKDRPEPLVLCGSTSKQIAAAEQVKRERADATRREKAALAKLEAAK